MNVRRTETTAREWIPSEIEHTVHKFILVWVDSNMDEINDKYRDLIIQLKSIVNTVNTYTDPDQCIDFVTEMDSVKVFMIVSGAFGQYIIPHIHALYQLEAIYIFCENESCYETWTNNWAKVNGVSAHIDHIYELIKRHIRQHDQDLIPVSFIQLNYNELNKTLDELDQSFMYTQLLKEIILDLDYGEQPIAELSDYFRKLYYNNDRQLQFIDEFGLEYFKKTPIWWYTREWFLYRILNHALRILEVDTIVKMGFFVQDLHRQLEQLHIQQKNDEQIQTCNVYRGQGMLQTDFDRLQQSTGGLMSFNSFLSTSKNREMAFAIADSNRYNPALVGIFFEITIDTSISRTPFADIKKYSCIEEENEILFSMQTVFRVGEIKRIDSKNKLWQVNLRLTGDNDELLNRVEAHIREETQGTTGWHRLGKLLFKLGQFPKAEDMYNLLLHKVSDNDEKAYLYGMLGLIGCKQGKNEEAISFYEKSLEIWMKILPSNHPDFAITYNNIGLVYENMGEYSKALTFYEKSLEIQQKTLRPDHSELAALYNNIGMAYLNIGNYTNALLFYRNSLDIWKKTLPPNHPDFANAYNNIAMVYMKTQEYSKARLFYEKSLDIVKRTLPPNHPNFATAYNNIAAIYEQLEEYPNALSLYMKTLEIFQNSLSANHPSLAAAYNNIGIVYMNMEEYSKALSFYLKSLEIFQNGLPSNHPSLASSYHNIGFLYDKMGEYSKALSFYEKSIKLKKTFPLKHSSLTASYNNIAMIYFKMREYSNALLYYEKSLEISKETLPSNHYNLAESYNNIGMVYHNMGDYTKALSFCELAFDIVQRSIPSDHSQLQAFRENLELIKKNL